MIESNHENDSWILFFAAGGPLGDDVVLGSSPKEALPCLHHFHHDLVATMGNTRLTKDMRRCLPSLRSPSVGTRRHPIHCCVLRLMVDTSVSHSPQELWAISCRHARELRPTPQLSILKKSKHPRLYPLASSPRMILEQMVCHWQS